MTKTLFGLLLVAFHVAAAPPPTADNCYYCNKATEWATKILGPADQGQIIGMNPDFYLTVADLTCDPFNSPSNCIETAKFIANATWSLGGPSSIDTAE
uniref:Uncharacterized protein n=1 Tax=Plectus sambesii TaxID=2011161 RepID=A0A914WQD9_9BILA